MKGRYGQCTDNCGCDLNKEKLEAEVKKLVFDNCTIKKVDKEALTWEDYAGVHALTQNGDQYRIDTGIVVQKLVSLIEVERTVVLPEDKKKETDITAFEWRDMSHDYASAYLQGYYRSRNDIKDLNPDKTFKELT